MTEFLDIDREAQAHDYENAQPKFDLQIAKESVITETQTSIERLISGVESGDINGLEVFAVFKKLEAIFDTAKKKVEEYAMDEAERYNEKTFKLNEVTFSVRKGYAKYDFASDPIYREISEKLKQRETLLKTALKSDSMIFDEHGIEVPKVQISSYTKDSISVKF